MQETVLELGVNQFILAPCTKMKHDGNSAEIKGKLNGKITSLEMGTGMQC